MNRITAHTNIERLIQIGLVSEVPVGGRRAIVAEPPTRLQYLVEQKIEESQNIERKLPDILKEIEEITPLGITNKSVKTTFHEGKQAVLLIYKDILLANEVYSFVNVDKYYEVFPDTEEIFKKAFDENPERKVRAIVLDSPLAREIEEDDQESYPNYVCKYIPNTRDNTIFDFASFADYQIYDDKVAIIQSEKGKVYTTLIQSKLIYTSFKSLHKYIWKMLG